MSVVCIQYIMNHGLDKIDGWTVPGTSTPYFKIMSTDTTNCMYAKEKFNRVIYESFNDLDDLSPVELIFKTSRLKAELNDSITQLLRDCKSK